MAIELLSVIADSLYGLASASRDWWKRYWERSCIYKFRKCQV